MSYNFTHPEKSAVQVGFSYPLPAPKLYGVIEIVQLQLSVRGALSGEGAAIKFSLDGSIGTFRLSIPLFRYPS